MLPYYVATMRMRVCQDKTTGALLRRPPPLAPVHSHRLPRRAWPTRPVAEALGARPTLARPVAPRAAVA